jgi:hypothetical protein
MTNQAESPGDDRASVPVAANANVGHSPVLGLVPSFACVGFAPRSSQTLTVHCFLSILWDALRGCCRTRRGFLSSCTYSTVYELCLCIELDRYMNIFYSIAIIVKSEDYNERVNETPH